MPPCRIWSCVVGWLVCGDGMGLAILAGHTFRLRRWYCDDDDDVNANDDVSVNWILDRSGLAGYWTLHMQQYCWNVAVVSAA